jgi:large subunit ribosomal protein L35
MGKVCALSVPLHCHETWLIQRVTGDLNKPIYRHLADKQWRAHKRLLLMQRITQMNVIPDILPSLDPVVSTTLSFPSTRKKFDHGEIVPSTTSEQPPTLSIQPYDKGKRLYTIAVINPDVPDVEKDGFTYRCHFLAANVEIEPTQTRVHLGKLSDETQTILPWLPAYTQKGLDYQRMGIFVLEQPRDPSTTASLPLDVNAIKEAGPYTQRDGFILRSFVDKFALEPVGVDLFRTIWDEGTAGVMKRAGIPGWDVEFKRKRIEPLPYQRKDSERYR